jgi:eukaryotic-like serine/threonine-protein kinase
VVGLKLTRAKTKIRARHCRVGKITRATSTQAKKGRVLSQRPKPGKTLRKGAKIALKVGKGQP